MGLEATQITMKKCLEDGFDISYLCIMFVSCFWGISGIIQISTGKHTQFTFSKNFVKFTKSTCSGVGNAQIYR